MTKPKEKKEVKVEPKIPVRSHKKKVEPEPVITRVRKFNKRHRIVKV